MSENFEKKTVLVTGSSKGIGRAVAIRLAEDGYDLVLHYGHDKKGATETLSMVEVTGQSGRLLQFDISDRSQCLERIEADISDHGAHYGVVLNAGIASDNAFPAMSSDQWDNVIDTNLNGFYNVLHPLIMPMIQRRKPGRIVAMTSVSGLVGNRGQVNYAATKAGIIGAAKSLALELAKRQITVNCVAPGIIETQMTEGLDSSLLKSLVPMRRAGCPKEVAALVSFLCSEDAGYITRQVISVNGGMV